MAKRRRLTPALPSAAAPEVKSMVRAPIADIASDTAASAALGEVAGELTRAREEGRMVLSLPLSAIRLDHLVRDRIAQDENEFKALIESISARGQQAPIEVMEAGDGSYGLISGWRRCQALEKLTTEGRHDGTVLALLRRPSDAGEAYQAMIEENEIRVPLSYFERARIARKAVDQGVFETEKVALLTLFRGASRAKRSKIRSFLPLVKAFDGVLRFPHHLGERLGLRISALLEADPAQAEVMIQALIERKPFDAMGEVTLLGKLVDQAERAATSPQPPAPATGTATQQIGPGLKAEWRRGSASVTLTGPKMTDALREKLIVWLRHQK